MSINPINFLDQVEHRIDDAGRFRESGERLVATTLSHTSSGPWNFLHFFIRDDTEPGNEGSIWFSPSSTTERKVRWVGQHLVVIDLCEAFLAKRQASKNASLHVSFLILC